MRLPPFFLVVLWATACVPEGVPVNEPPRLALNGILSPELDIAFTLSRSVPAFGPDTTSREVTQGKVVLHEVGGGADTLILDPVSGRFVPQFITRPSINTGYWVEAWAPGFDRVYSDTVWVPAPEPIVAYTFAEDTNSSGQANVTMTIHPVMPRSTHFYLVGESYYGEEKDDNNIFTFKSPHLKNGCLSDPDGFDSEIFFPASCFFRLPATISFSIRTVSWSNGTSKADSVRLIFRTINPDLYQYYQTRYQPSDFELAFSEPGNVHSNMNGGYGLLAAYSESRVVVKL